MHFGNLDLRIGQIKAVQDHENADKLYILLVNLGKLSRDIQLVAGIKESYSKDELINKKIILIRNLEPVIIRGTESNGMLLAVSENKNIVLLTVKKSKPGDKVFIDDMKDEPLEKISFKDFKKIHLLTVNNHIVFEGKILKTEKEEIFTDKEVSDGLRVG